MNNKITIGPDLYDMLEEAMHAEGRLGHLTVGAASFQRETGIPELPFVEQFRAGLLPVAQAIDLYYLLEPCRHAGGDETSVEVLRLTLQESVCRVMRGLTETLRTQGPPRSFSEQVERAFNFAFLRVIDRVKSSHRRLVFFRVLNQSSITAADLRWSIYLELASPRSEVFNLELRVDYNSDTYCLVTAFKSEHGA